MINEQQRTLDCIYLEYSLLTKAVTKRELESSVMADKIMNIIIHGQYRTEGERLQHIYDLAKDIYETTRQVPHYWHKPENKPTGDR